MTPQGLREEQAGVEMVIARGIERDVMEGDGRSGRGAVVQMVARRYE